MFLGNLFSKLFNSSCKKVDEDLPAEPRVQYIDLIDETSTKPFIAFTTDKPTSDEFDLVETTCEELEHEIKIDAKGNVYYKFPKVNKWILQKDIKHIEVRIID